MHCHPSGDATPSEADIKVTRDLIRAGQLLKVDLLDHVIMGTATADRPGHRSLRELGFFSNERANSGRRLFTPAGTVSESASKGKPQ
ncbi:MAG: JAB domain-containing protein [Verrucomicrobiia bacterium]